MPLQNRVTPFGELVAIPERGTMMGNRGILHDGDGRIRRRWASKLWICCLLEYQGRRDPVMAPNHYTRLFFLDELTALAAGHRPCAYCRRSDYNAFRAAWAEGNHQGRSTPVPSAVQMDAALHGERLEPDRSKRLHRTYLERLPDGVFFTPEASEEPDAKLPAQLLWRGAVWRWSPGGYRESAPVRPGSVLLLTPPSIVGALAGGYVPGSPFGLA